jgi:hypothetical protein
MTEGTPAPQKEIQAEPKKISRRSLLKMGGGAALAAATGLSLSSLACTTSTAPTTEQSPSQPPAAATSGETAPATQPKPKKEVQQTQPSDAIQASVELTGSEELQKALTEAGTLVAIQMELLKRLASDKDYGIKRNILSGTPKLPISSLVDSGKQVVGGAEKVGW